MCILTYWFIRKVNSQPKSAFAVSFPFDFSRSSCIIGGMQDFFHEQDFFHTLWVKRKMPPPPPIQGTKKFNAIPSEMNKLFAINGAMSRRV